MLKGCLLAVDLDEEEEKDKLRQRAERFGLKGDMVSTETAQHESAKWGRWSHLIILYRLQILLLLHAIAKSA